MKTPTSKGVVKATGKVAMATETRDATTTMEVDKQAEMAAMTAVMAMTMTTGEVVVPTDGVATMIGIGVTEAIEGVTMEADQVVHSTGAMSEKSGQ